jgi:hypothetical protein
MFRVAVTVLLTTMVVLFGVIAARIEPTPEALAQRAKKEEWAKIDKQAQQKAEAEELERLRNSPKVRKKVAQLALAKQFPGECGGAANVADGSDGKIYGRCSSGETFLVEGGVAMRCSALAKLGIRSLCP